MTITNDPAYASLRPCAQSCYTMVWDGPDRLASAIGCEYTANIQNECVCRADLVRVASSTNLHASC